MPNATKLNHIPNAVTRTLICVDSVAASDFEGTVYNPYLPEPVPFAHIRDILATLDTFFDSIAYPQSYFQHRSFLEGKPDAEQKLPEEPKRYQDDTLFDQYRGRLGTFEVEVKFRQNATWQGEITWKERELTRPFRSMLEMIKLMDQAVTDPQE